MSNYTKSGSGPLLIYLPGMEGTGQLFFRQEPLLSRNFRVVTVPLRSQTPFEYQDLIDDVLGVFKAEQTTEAVIVGESFGGTVALQFALRHPQLVKHLILVNSFSYFRRRIRLQLAFLLLPLAFTRPGRAFRNFIFRRVLTSESIDQAGVDALMKCSFSHGYLASRQRLSLIEDHDVREQLSYLKMPVAIIAAAKDKLMPSLAEARFMKSRIPRSRLIVLPEEGHSCFLSGHFSLASIFQENAIL